MLVVTLNQIKLIEKKNIHQTISLTTFCTWKPEESKEEPGAPFSANMKILHYEIVKYFGIRYICFRSTLTP